MNEQMTKRQWLEFGKMWNKMEACDGFDFGVYFLANKKFDKTAYDLLKEQYFLLYLDQRNTELVNFDLPEDLLEKLYEIADEEDITIDELIIDILMDTVEKEKEKEKALTEKALTEKYQPGRCCFNCCNGIDKEKYEVRMGCLHLQKTVHRSFVCGAFKGRI